jgi:hypothetical protein
MPETTTEPAAPAETETAPEAPPATREEQQPETDKATPSPWDDPAAAKAEIERLRRENASERVNAKTAAAEAAKAELAQQIGKALGLVKDDEPADPAKLTEQLTTQQKATQTAQLELAIYKAAAAKGADPNALLDSRSFMDRATADPSALDALIGEQLTSNPRLKAAQAAPVGGADFTSTSSAGGRTFTRAQIADPAYYQANKADILDALTHGRITA